MNTVSEPWFCPSCGERFTSTPPDHRLCDECLDQLESLGYAPAPGAPYGDLPPCSDCGGQMVEVMPFPQSPARSAAGSIESDSQKLNQDNPLHHRDASTSSLITSGRSFVMRIGALAIAQLLIAKHNDVQQSLSGRVPSVGTLTWWGVGAVWSADRWMDVVWQGSRRDQ